MITVPAETAKMMQLETGDDVAISYDPMNKQMIVNKLVSKTREQKEGEEIMKILVETMAYFEKGHYKLASLRHSDRYLFVRLALSYEDKRARIAHILTRYFEEDDIDIVATFTVGGALLGREVAKLLGAKFVVGKKIEREVIFVNVHQIKKGDNVLLVDDVLTTGGSITQAMKTIRSLNKGAIKGVGVVVDRSKGNSNLGVKTVGLIKLDLTQYDEKVCPMCQEGSRPLDLSRVESDRDAALRSLYEEGRGIMAKGFDEYDEMLENAEKEVSTQSEVRS